MEDRFLVTGATGFVGACLTRFLISQDKKVSIIVRNKKLNWRLSDISSKLTIYECDILNNSLHEVVNKVKPTVIFHLASYGSLPDETDADRMIDVNIKGTLNIVNAVKDNKFKLFINTGSSSEYGTKKISMNESALPAPINDYGVTKTAATLFCSKIARSENLPIITFRLFSPYGYFEEKNRLIPSIILSLMKNEPINLSSPTYVRDFIFIDDVIDAYIKALEFPLKPGQIFNIGSGKQHSVKDVLAAILQETKTNPTIVWDSVKKQARQDEPKHWQADITKAKKTFKWRPKNDLYQGIAKTLNWFRINNKLYEN